MVTQKVIVVASMNISPEDEVAQRLAELGDGWHVVSATTVMTPVGTIDVDEPRKNFFGVAMHMYYATTLVVEKEKT